MLSLAGPSAFIWAQSQVEVSNPAGSLVIRASARENMQVTRSRPGRAPLPGDCRIERGIPKVRVRCAPADKGPVNLLLEVPFGLEIQAETGSADIDVDGLFRLVSIHTETGKVHLKIPIDATDLHVEAKQAPSDLSLPAQTKRLRVMPPEKGKAWAIEAHWPKNWVTWGRIEVAAARAPSITIEDKPIPDDAPVKLPWQAPGLADELLSEVRDPEGEGRAAESGSGEPAGGGAEFVFRSEVRLVNLSVAVTDDGGHPVHGLQPPDFLIKENGTTQRILAADSESVPFNLALLLDLSGSTINDRPAMQEAARRFAALTRPNDRIALYALANNTLAVLSRLSSDREKWSGFMDSIPKIGGGSPIYDAIVLGLAEELRQRRGQRNALIVLTDGIDNTLLAEPGSVTPFSKLRKVVKALDVLVYPVFLDSLGEARPPVGPRRRDPARQVLDIAKGRLEQLAEESGGRLFTARSVRDLEPVYAEVEEELRSVYSLSYYPANQKFGGEWRQLALKVNRKGVKVRTREGYFAR